MRFYLDDLSEPRDFTDTVPSPVLGRDLRPDCACGKPRAARPKKRIRFLKSSECETVYDFLRIIVLRFLYTPSGTGISRSASRLCPYIPINPFSDFDYGIVTGNRRDRSFGTRKRFRQLSRLSRGDFLPGRTILMSVIARLPPLSGKIVPASASSFRTRKHIWFSRLRFPGSYACPGTAASGFLRFFVSWTKRNLSLRWPGRVPV